MRTIAQLRSNISYEIHKMYVELEALKNNSEYHQYEIITEITGHWKIKIKLRHPEAGLIESDKFLAQVNGPEFFLVLNDVYGMAIRELKRKGKSGNFESARAVNK